MTKAFQAIKGMNDCLPDASPTWQYLENCLRETAASYGYAEIRMPIVENTQLFCRSIGEVTDIVEKEMYTFVDKGEDSLTLRPEGTASCVRAGIQHGLLYNQQQRLWYMGPMFRRERPQKGRYRQFFQFGAEAFGMEGPDVDVELIALTARLWKKLGFADEVELQLNSLGSNQAREAYKAILVEYFAANQDSLDEDSQRRLHSNPLRILDSKNPAMAELIAAAPKLNEHLDEASKTHFEGVCSRLDSLGIQYRINPTLVRGLDYYNRTVFEWVTTSLGSQGTICAGGRYDGLVEQLGGQATTGCGFAMGLERIILMLEQQSAFRDKLSPPVDVYLCMLGDAAEQAGIQFAEKLRDLVPSCRLQAHCGGGNFKKQLKRADRSKARIALILGEDEVAAQNITLKFLRENIEQKTLTQQELLNELPSLLSD
ncbi:histidine--tRNA ligase [Aliikangiella coralliicola]|uniref:Histidine--tRNA ligase n=1 Tax=Aliikangiella coralliicola TaxID=2592383 RepID=A0A545UBP7_9GAMM|nr:histidine--tRNA ligase [Aliikangiella coralliicola]TQV86895.1 histidine--tRNA ligase [Aliikangiella coralliicola]